MLGNTINVCFIMFFKLVECLQLYNFGGYNFFCLHVTVLTNSKESKTILRDPKIVWSFFFVHCGIEWEEKSFDSRSERLVSQE